MTDTAKTLTTAEYSKQSGIAVSTITRMLRDGQLKGEKRGGKWVIFSNDGHSQPATEPLPSNAATHVSVVRYTIENFAKMTYLTENGVRQWLKTGRLTGRPDDDGQWQVDAGNLDRPELRHLLRK